MIESDSRLSTPTSFNAQLVRLVTISRISPSLASSARAVQRSIASSIGTWRSSLIADASAWPISGATSIARSRDEIAPLTNPPSRSSSRLSARSPINLDAPRRMRVSWPCGACRNRPAMPARSMVRIRRATTGAIRKFSLRNAASASPMRSLLRGMIAVWGIGRPSGWRNSAVTANQSASPPTIAASANALTHASAGCAGSSARAPTNTAAITTSIPVAAAFIPAAPGWVGLNRDKAGARRRITLA